MKKVLFIICLMFSVSAMAGNDLDQLRAESVKNPVSKEVLSLLENRALKECTDANSAWFFTANQAISYYGVFRLLAILKDNKESRAEIFGYMKEFSLSAHPLDVDWVKVFQAYLKAHPNK